MPHRMLLGDDEPVSLSSEILPFHTSEADHGTVRSDGQITIVAAPVPIWRVLGYVGRRKI